MYVDRIATTGNNYTCILIVIQPSQFSRLVTAVIQQYPTSLQSVREIPRIFEDSDFAHLVLRNKAYKEGLSWNFWNNFHIYVQIEKKTVLNK